ncbi:kinetochore complex Sim4 subunit Fta1-domain-containing protein [Aspergillus filifer]
MATSTKIGLLNTSWTCHRLSPLHHSSIEIKAGSLLKDAAALNLYAARLRDHLTNSLADATGWRAAAGGAEDEPSSAGGLSALGALQGCTWGSISSLDFLNSEDAEEDSDRAGEPAGLLITLAYENSTYRAAMLCLPSESDAKAESRLNAETQAQSQSRVPQKRKRGRPSLKSSSAATSNTNARTSTTLPLLLTRLPKPLRESLISFLSSNFDTYVSPLRISSAGLAGLLESYVAALQSSPSSSLSSAAAGDEGVEVQVQVQDIIRELSLTLSFAPPIAPSLKALNLGIPRETLGSFLASSPTSVSTSSSSPSSSVLNGLSEYVRKHVAMELGLPLPVSLSSSDPSVGEKADEASLVGGYVRLTKIACAGFVVTSEGKLKIVAKDTNGGGDGDGDGGRNKGALRGGEALLRVVLERAAGVGVRGFRNTGEEE